MQVQQVPHDGPPVEADVGGVAGLRELREPAEVAAGCERPLGSGQQHGTGFPLVAEVLEQVRELVVHLLVDLVEVVVGLVYGHHQHVVVPVEA